MFFCYVFFGACRLIPCTALKERLMPDSNVKISWADYLLAIVPIAVSNSAGLALGNLAVKHASVAFLQMIKPANLIWGSLVAFAFKVEVASLTHMIVVIIVVCGVTIASARNADFSLLGFVLQLLATFTEGSKLVLIQNVTSKRLKLDSLTAIFKYSPIACCCLMALSLAVEGVAPWAELPSKAPIVGSNAMAAVVLNVLIVGTVSRTSAVVFIFGGVIKDIGTIAASMLLFGSPVGINQVAGFGLSIMGILMYKVYKQNLDVFLGLGFVKGFVTVTGFNLTVARKVETETVEIDLIGASADVYSDRDLEEASEDHQMLDTQDARKARTRYAKAWRMSTMTLCIL
eukprot:gnl/TRDRNA2_/TRDRNA2_147517_c0_seq2.p1 gnl/TRDRNA2_/TRDRNA2_147517_c0~~gnl/TRDRNA2_/TRDRNA2_147517_c0_seq2.p1  ORF type:complete len:345 (-),score=44.96 gnl/TRDRNA2_/TRDRNA2_147517_c0_seq2:542-1576(-)